MQIDENIPKSKAIVGLDVCTGIRPLRRLYHHQQWARQSLHLIWWPKGTCCSQSSLGLLIFELKSRLSHCLIAIMQDNDLGSKLFTFCKCASLVPPGLRTDFIDDSDRCTINKRNVYHAFLAFRSKIDLDVWCARFCANLSVPSAWRQGIERTPSVTVRSLFVHQLPVIGRFRPVQRASMVAQKGLPTPQRPPSIPFSLIFPLYLCNG